MPQLRKAEFERIKKQQFCKGVRAGERRTKRLVKKVSRVNRELLGLVNLIDLQYPVTGVTISFAMADRIIKGLKSPKACKRLAGELQNIVKNCNCELGALLAQWENELRELIGNREQ
jgi:hypothetical protein